MTSKPAKCGQPKRGTRTQDEEIARIIRWLIASSLTAHIDLKGGVEFRERAYE
jgi:hypothetical protein